MASRFFSNETEKELISSRENFRKLTVHLQRAREEERTRIAREIHDELGQVLATVHMGVSLLADEYRDHQHLTNKIKPFEEMLEGAIKTVQRIVSELRPLILDMLGLADALEWQVNEFRKRTGIECSMESLLLTKDFDPDVATAIFRILQETLTNIMRHAKATRVKITLAEKRNHIVLTVRDNGAGITREQGRNGNAFGIMGMRERANALGGKVNIVGVPEKGTVVVAHIPLTPAGAR